MAIRPMRNPQITLKEDDLVRISKANKPFRRGYLPGWSDEVFTVAKVYDSYPTTYKLQEMKAEAIKRRFYAEETSENFEALR
ncbi:chromo domain-containing protein [Trichonephila clavata]|uniref:Chromo domain-containing protein n=1 Tax=Trichonephila clavata TaxID=2740835 RepID=A0A8X6KFE7_TRICU|nr:chromo domain-containing protein [Trichonephila clavata]